MDQSLKVIDFIFIKTYIKIVQISDDINYPTIIIKHSF
jgi:hypothetical protein